MIFNKYHEDIETQFSNLWKITYFFKKEFINFFNNRDKYLHSHRDIIRNNPECIITTLVYENKDNMSCTRERKSQQLRRPGNCD